MSKHAVFRRPRRFRLFVTGVTKASTKGDFARRLDDLAKEIREGRLKNERRRKIDRLIAIDGMRKRVARQRATEAA